MTDSLGANSFACVGERLATFGDMQDKALASTQRIARLRAAGRQSVEQVSHRFNYRDGARFAVLCTFHIITVNPDDAGFAVHVRPPHIARLRDSSSRISQELDKMSAVARAPGAA
jgi:hypothetical protein